MSLFPAAFWSLALAHAVALVSPGPDTILVLSHSMRHRLSGSFCICVGIALGNAVYILLAIAGWAGMRDYPLLYRAVELAGALYLVWLGIRLIKAGRKPMELHIQAATKQNRLTQLGLGLGSALLNPKNMVFYLSIMTTLIESEATLSQRIMAGLWMTSAVLLWDIFIAVCVSSPAVRKKAWSFLPTIETVCGCLLIFLACSLVAGPLLAH